jgi:dihydroorotate dehydrogenase electron transfer subunit
VREHERFDIQNRRKPADSPRDVPHAAEGRYIGFNGPGQFVSLSLDGFFLRRPISVCDAEGDMLTLIYKTVGRGQRRCAALKRDGAEGVDTASATVRSYKGGEKPLLIGGGAGVPPMYFLAKKLRASAKRSRSIIGFNTAEEAFYESEFFASRMQDGGDTPLTGRSASGASLRTRCRMTAATITPAARADAKAVYDVIASDGEMSFEERMGCGFGACMGCSRKTTNGYKRVCRDGPVFKKGEIIWED